MLQHNNLSQMELHTLEALVGTGGWWDTFFGSALETVNGVGDASMAQLHQCRRLPLLPYGILIAMAEQLHKV